MPVPNPQFILKPEVVFWAFLRMRSAAVLRKGSISCLAVDRGESISKFEVNFLNDHFA
jgi:hypothetical protein